MQFHEIFIFFFSVPTALKGTVSHNAPIVHVEKEIHTVNQPVHVEKPYEVPYDVIKHVEKIVEVPTPVHVSVPVPVEVPHPVLGKNFIAINIVEKNICTYRYLHYMPKLHISTKKFLFIEIARKIEEKFFFRIDQGGKIPSRIIHDF